VKTCGGLFPHAGDERKRQMTGIAVFFGVNRARMGQHGFGHGVAARAKARAVSALGDGRNACGGQYAQHKKGKERQVSTSPGFLRITVHMPLLVQEITHTQRPQEAVIKKIHEEQFWWQAFFRENLKIFPQADFQRACSDPVTPSRLPT
jgi:hypothetical protein